MKLTGSGVLAIAAVLAVGALAWWLYNNRQKFNPASDKNIVYQGAGSVVKEITGGAAAGGEDTLGGLIARLAEERPGIGQVFDRIRKWVSGDDKNVRNALKSAGAASPTSSADFQKQLMDVWL